MVVVIAIGTFIFQYTKAPDYRYHQHIEEVEKEICKNHKSDEFCTHLPLFDIHTEKEIPNPFVVDENNVEIMENYSKVANNETVHANVRFINSKLEPNHLKDEAEVEEKAQFRIRGNSSREFDKKNYLIKFTENDYIKKKNVPLDSMQADSTWILHGPFLDKTMIRNYMCNNIVAEITGYAPNVRLCELFLNDEYQGVYLLSEKINRTRLNLSKTDPKDINTSFILSFNNGRVDESHKLFTFADDSGKRGVSYRSNEKLEIDYPSTTLTEAQHFQIQHEISTFEKILTNKKPNKKYREFIDMDSFVDYYVLSEFFMNLDAGKKSTYIVKDVRGKMQLVGWDYNNTFNNYFNDLSKPQKFCVNSTWTDYLLKDPYFVERVNKRYRQLRKTYLSDEYLLNYIDDTLKFLGPAIDRNNEKWGYSYTEEFIKNPNHKFQVLQPLHRNPESFQEAVEQMKKAIVERGKFLDENIETLYSKTQARREE